MHCATYTERSEDTCRRLSVWWSQQVVTESRVRKWLENCCQVLWCLLSSYAGQMVSFKGINCLMCKHYFCSLKNFYGLRDFIHFINYIRRKRLDYGSITPKLVLKSLERNFNGNENFRHICLLFLEKVSSIVNF